jgi:hypothetical protein
LVQFHLRRKIGEIDLGHLQHFKCYLQRNLARKFKEIWRENFLLLSPPTFNLGALADVVKKEVVKQKKFFLLQK